MLSLRVVEKREELEKAVPFTVNTKSVQSINVNRVIPIIVGGATLTFTPNSVQAAPGDILQFQFASRNHTVTQSIPTNPCQPNLDGPGVDETVHSGFIAFSNDDTHVGTFNVPVRDTEPMFLYCAQAQHCQKGMVMAVNAQSQDLINYANLAKKMLVNVPGRFVNGGTAGKLPLADAAFQDDENQTSSAQNQPAQNQPPQHQPPQNQPPQNQPPQNQPPQSQPPQNQPPQNQPPQNQPPQSQPPQNQPSQHQPPQPQNQPPQDQPPQHQPPQNQPPQHQPPQHQPSQHQPRQHQPPQNQSAQDQPAPGPQDSPRRQAIYR